MTITSGPPSMSLEEQRDAFAERLRGDVIRSLEVASVYVGVQLGLYRALDEHGPLAAPELAERTGIHPRYAVEWLEQQTVAGILAFDLEQQRFRLPEAHRHLLVRASEEHGMGELAGLTTALMAILLQTPAVIAAYRSGGGVSFEQYGIGCSHGLDGMNPDAGDDPVATTWIPAMPDVHQRLASDRPACVADIGCSGGKALLALAHRYPHIRADGYDLDQASVDLARRNAERAGVADRVRFHCRDAAELTGTGDYDLVMSIASLHDFAQPVPVLAAMRAMTGERGTVFVADPLLDPFTGQTGEMSDRFAYAASVLHCLPTSMVFQPTAATGCAMTEATFRGYAADAGFSAVEIVLIEREGFLGFYRLTP